MIEFIGKNSRTGTKFHATFVNDVLTRRNVSPYGRTLKSFVLSLKNIRETIMFYLHWADVITVDGVEVAQKDFAKMAYDQLMGAGRYKEAILLTAYTPGGWKERQELEERAKTALEEAKVANRKAA